MPSATESVSTKNIYDNNTIYMGDLKQRAFDALGQLEAAALSAAFSYANYAEQVIPSPTGAYKTLDLNSLPDPDTVLAGINKINIDGFPDVPTPDDIDKYKTYVWEGDQLKNLQTTITNYIDSMGMPSQSFQDAIFDSGKERINRTFNDSVDLIAAKQSARGFKYANSMLNADLLKLAEDRNDAYYDQSRKIEELMTNWAKDNLHFAIQQGLAVETAQMDFAYKFSSIFRDIFKLQMDAVLEKFKAETTVEITKLDANIKLITSRFALYESNSNIEHKKDLIELDTSKENVQQALGKYRESILDLHQRAMVQFQTGDSLARTTADLVKATSNTILGVITQKQATSSSG
jgi:hypothetical protein